MGNDWMMCGVRSCKMSPLSPHMERSKLKYPSGKFV